MLRYVQAVTVLCVTVVLSSCSSSPVKIAASTSLPSVTPIAPKVSETSPVVESTSAPSCEGKTEGRESAHLAGEDYIDGTTVSLGENFTKTWTLSNTGETAWTDDYQVVFYAAPQGEKLEAPEKMSIGQCVLPGEDVSISMPMTAPEKAGRYTVVFQLTNTTSQVIPVDGGNFWISIHSGSPPLNSATVAGSSPSSNGVTVTLSSISSDYTQTRAELCFDFPSQDGWIPLDVVLAAGGQTFGSVGGALGTYPFRCYYSIFQVSLDFLNQQAAYQIVVGKITPLELVENQRQRCEQIKPELKARYLGLDFICLESGSGRYVGNLSAPQGFTLEQAEVLVSDAIQGAVYGPWVVSISR